MLTLGLAAAGCQGPLQHTTDAELRDQLIGSYKRQLDAIAAGTVVEVQREPSEVVSRLSPERRAELEAMSGIGAYDDQTIDPGDNLDGAQDVEIVRLTLREVIETAVRNNLDLQVARLTPAINQTQVTQAMAAFDATFFTEGSYGRLTSSGFQALEFLTPGDGIAEDDKDEPWSVATGLRKPLMSGGDIELRSTWSRDSSRASVFSAPTDFDTTIQVDYSQPLLRGFGTDVNRAQIVLAQNARRQSMHQLRQDLMDLVANVEEAYWNLLLAAQRLQIQTRLLNRTTEDRDRLEARREFDVQPVRLTEANSFVELRRADVIRLRQAARTASDRLKQLMHAPDLPVSGEALILPADLPVEDPITFSLLDAVTTAMQRRPELEQALLQIKDASVRQRVADNARLPLLDLGITFGISGESNEGIGGAYDDLDEGDLIDYLLTTVFEVPIGNRQAEALFAQRTLERRQAVTAYQRTAQAVVVDVKSALRELITAYQLIGAARAARLAAADSLRAIEARELAGEALTAEFLLDLKLQTQQRLADAEVQEVQALADYNNAIAQVYRSTGTLLERNNITFRDLPWNEPGLE